MDYNPITSNSLAIRKLFEKGRLNNKYSTSLFSLYYNFAI